MVNLIFYSLFLYFSNENFNIMQRFIIKPQQTYNFTFHIVRSATLMSRKSDSSPTGLGAGVVAVMAEQFLS